MPRDNRISFRVRTLGQSSMAMTIWHRTDPHPPLHSLRITRNHADPVVIVSALKWAHNASTVVEP